MALRRLSAAVYIVMYVSRVWDDDRIMRRRIQDYARTDMGLQGGTEVHQQRSPDVDEIVEGGAPKRDGAEAFPAHDSRRAAFFWPAVLFLATFVTTTWAGALHQGIDIVAEPARWTAGVPYALALLAILGVHELGHYVVARRRGVDVTLPYFIPAPFYLGTFGAFIRMRSLAKNRAATFDIAVAGPLAGFVVALIALIMGLQGDPGGVHGGATPASSFLLAAIYTLVTGAAPQDTVQLGALAFAGWIGVVVTAINLAPVGQLDGGHIAYALLGRRRAAVLGQALILLMVGAGFLYARHWLVWAFFVWAFAGTGHPPSLSEEAGLGRGRAALATAAFALLLVIVLPWPR